jgi:hypothetical protein
MGFMDHGLFGRRKLAPDEEYVPLNEGGVGNPFTGRRIRKKAKPVGGLATPFKINTDVIKDEPVKDDDDDNDIPSYLRPPGARR